MDAGPAKEPMAQDDASVSSPSPPSSPVPSKRDTPTKTESTVRPKSLVDSEPTASPGHDSMVTVRLSEPPSLSVNTDLPPSTLPSRRSYSGPTYTPTGTVAAKIEEAKAIPEAIPEEDMEADLEIDSDAAESRNSADEMQEEVSEEIDESDDVLAALGPGLDDEAEDTEAEEVNWDKLQKSEDEEAQDGDDKSTAMLLARLEEENNKLAVNPKGVKVKVVEQPAARRPRPPSMAQLREMVSGPSPSALRYSALPPPPMTDLEFYMALVRDYQQTAARLPTLLSRKIRQGIPPPLRGVVWQSMAGARDGDLLEQYERLSGESSPYEGIIGKDLGRSFPGVDMFRDPEGDGQRMLGRVLKCFSLYDQKIGYCQGLAFLVGPLLMHMPDREAFCVLVRLMDHYDLRSCFHPDLAGLHVRMYQYEELLRQNEPAVSAHLEELQVDHAYVSQWFLSFFAVTCPLPMLFRIYDVIFAEGASETIMRVALSVMRKNASRILACQEMEDVMQLLLSRGLWDCYHYNADDFVDDFVSLSSVVSREKLAQLEQNYREAQVAPANAASEVSTGASRFLGRLWTATGSSGSPKSAVFGALSPGLTAPSRPLSMLRRSTSKQSLASTLNSMDASSASVLSSSSTEATNISRDSNPDDGSARESTPTNSKQSATTASANNAGEHRALHSQIEDLLTALSELQRNHALLATQLQREREDRDEERKAVKALLDGLQKATVADPESGHGETKDTETINQLMEGVAERFAERESNRESQGLTVSETKSQLRDEVARTKEHLMNEVAKTQEMNRRIDELGKETQLLKDQVRESHIHFRNLHQDKQRLEKQVHTMRARASAEPETNTSKAEVGSWFLSSSVPAPTTAAGPASGPATNAGLRELKLGRSKSTPNSQGSSRSAGLVRTQTEPLLLSGAAAEPADENDALVLELVQAKTAEAIARQEADEYKQKLENLKKSYGIVHGEGPPPATSAGSVVGYFGRLASGSDASAGNVKTATPPSSLPTIVTPAAAPGASTPKETPANGGSFWAWRR